MDPWQIVAALATAFATTVGILWRENQKYVADLRVQRDLSQKLLGDAIDGTKRLASAWEERNRRESNRSRRDDP